MQGGDPIHVEIEPLNILVEIHCRRVGSARRRRVRLRRRVNIDFNEQLLLWQIGHDDPRIMRIVLNVMDLQGAGAVCQHMFGAGRKDFGFLFLARLAIGIERVGGL